ncbi:unnamed protein product [Paramecium primaurelia]|uniref:Uncharacterized protein n=1 Tax=Paramecium primaurelia TaxID=5886 RepID=A0A8S1JT03_PARPR|nr:unnamed protein product [Paramecium primaurelia]
MQQLHINLKSASYQNLQRIKSLDLLSPVSQRVLEQVRIQELKNMRTTKKKFNSQLKEVLHLDTNKKDLKTHLPSISQIPNQDQEITNKISKIKLKIVPKEENESKLNLQKFKFNDRNTIKPNKVCIKKKEIDNQQKRSQSFNNKIHINKVQYQFMEQLKSLSTTILYHLSQQTNQLDRQFDQLENQLSF